MIKTLKTTVNGASLEGKVCLSKTLANAFLIVKYQTNSFKNQDQDTFSQKQIKEAISGKEGIKFTICRWYDCLWKSKESISTFK